MYIHPQQGLGFDVRKLRREAGKWLKQLREERRLTQRQLAELVGVEYYTFISQLEVGRGRIPPDRYEVWAEALGLEPADFVKHLLRYYDPQTFRVLFGKTRKQRREELRRASAEVTPSSFPPEFPPAEPPSKTRGLGRKH